MPALVRQPEALPPAGSSVMTLPDHGPAPTAIGTTVGGGLLILAGLFDATWVVMINGSGFGQLLFGSGASSLGFTLLRWELTFGALVLGIVALLAARRHFVVVAVVALAMNLIDIAVFILQDIQLGLPVQVLQQWWTLLHTLAFCLLLILALSARATRVLKIVTMAVFVALLVRFMFSIHLGVNGDATTLAAVWASTAEALLGIAGWLVLIASVNTRAVL